MNPVYFRIMWMALAVAGTLLIATLALTRFRGRWCSLLRGALLVPAILALALAGYACWFNFLRRPPPPLAARELHPGLTYERIVGRHPDASPYVAHIARYTIGYKGTLLGAAANPVAPPPSTGRLNLHATRPSKLLAQSGGLFLINGDFFGPWRDNGPFDYQPRPHELTETAGATVLNGYPVVPPPAHSSGLTAALVIAGAPHEQIHIQSWSPGDKLPPISSMVCGRALLVENGLILPPVGSRGFIHQRHPRTVIALDRNGQTLIFLVVDGRQPGYSAGMTWAEMAEFTLAQGAWTALMLDGGGSSTMVTLHKGRPRVLNSPIHNTIPGRERPIANAIVIH